MDTKNPLNPPANEPAVVAETAPKETMSLPQEDVTQTTTTINTSSEPSKSQSNSPAPLKKYLSKKNLLIGGGGLLLCCIILGVIFGGKAADTDNENGNKATITPTQSANDIKKTNKTSANATASDHLLVYGAWTGQTSVIKTVDLATSGNTLVATLPLTIKKVTVLDKKTLLYIDQIDTQDHGKRISIYNTQDKNISNSFYAAEGYYIDTYVLSPNKKYLAMWEISANPETKQMQGGHSRVYAVDLTSPSVINLLFDEDITVTVPVHYPSAILNTGTVLADTYMANDPNRGGGREYGMSTVDLDGTNRKDIDAMQSGTYSSEPTLSDDGKYLLFAGYDGSKGDGQTIVNGYRQALLAPNTVELLNAQTLQRFALPNVPDSNIYSAVTWDLVSGNVMMKALSPDASKSGMFSYDLSKQTMDPLLLPQDSEYSYISQLPQGKTLVGIADTREANWGNLGEHSAYAFSQLSLFDTKNELKNLSVEEPFVQYITILPGNFFLSH